MMKCTTVYDDETLDERFTFFRNVQHVDRAIFRGDIKVRPRRGRKQAQNDEETVRQGTTGNVCGRTAKSENVNLTSKARPYLRKTTRAFNLGPPLRVKVRRVHFGRATKFLYSPKLPTVVKLGGRSLRPISNEDRKLEARVRGVTVKRLKYKHAREARKILRREGWLQKDCNPCPESEVLTKAMFQLKQSVEDEAHLLFARKTTPISQLPPFPLMDLDRADRKTTPLSNRFVTTEEYLFSLKDEELLYAFLANGGGRIPDFPPDMTGVEIPRKYLEPYVPEHCGLSLRELLSQQLHKECVFQGVDSALLENANTRTQYIQLFTV
jgi:hypothetical protein